MLLAAIGVGAAGHQQQRQQQHQMLLAENEAPDKPEPSAEAPFAGMFRSHRDTHMNAFDFDAVHADPDTMAGSRLQMPRWVRRTPGTLWTPGGAPWTLGGPWGAPWTSWRGLRKSDELL